ncbi:MAG TPA: hypothetical protein VFE72_02835 [Lysobacter sp.]|nr:hypothetical protein [Lysobacter sp.]
MPITTEPPSPPAEVANPVEATALQLYAVTEQKRARAIAAALNPPQAKPSRMQPGSLFSRVFPTYPGPK